MLNLTLERATNCSIKKNSKLSSVGRPICDAKMMFDPYMHILKAPSEMPFFLNVHRNSAEIHIRNLTSKIFSSYHLTSQVET